MSPWLAKATIAVEDERFRRHCGVDFIAVCRAVRDNALAGRRVSGASTLTMQLCRMMDDRDRTYAAKAIESFRALQLERLLNKDEILERYLNVAPYGGNLRGVEAAARRWFGRGAAELSLGEAALLAGLQQSPERLRPDRFLKRAMARRRVVLRRMEETGAITGALRREAESQPVKIVSGDDDPALSLTGTPGHFTALALQRRPRGGMTTLDSRLQADVGRLARAHAEGLPEGTQIAVVAIEVQGAGVEAMLGSLEFNDPAGGQVNGALAWRSPGSALKPFVYGAAFEAGRLAPDSTVYDVVIDSADWNPRNFDRVYRGPVRVDEALRLSLNVPAVHVAEALGPRRCEGFMAAAGVRFRGDAARRAGAGLAVGGAEARLLDVVNAYATLARGGEFRRPVFFVDEVSESRPAISADVCAALDEILSSRARRPNGMEIRRYGDTPWFMWKTGTSSGRRDAWAAGHNGRHAIGVWVGRFAGGGRSEYVGATAAEPLLAELFDLPQIRAVCGPIGEFTRIRATNPLPPPAETGGRLRILAPAEGASFVAVDGTVPVHAKANSDGPLSWFLNGRRQADASRGPIAAGPGRHRLLCVDSAGGAHTVEFFVR